MMVMLNIEHILLLNFSIIGTLSNTEAFSNAFKCKLGSPMNPKEKCHVW